MASNKMVEKDKKDRVPAELKIEAARKVKISDAVRKAKKKQQPSIEKSRRIRRRAQELYTEALATGKIPKGVRFEDIADDKFFKAMPSIKDIELKRELIRRASEKARKKQDEDTAKKRKKILRRR